MHVCKSAVDEARFLHNRQGGLEQASDALYFSTLRIGGNRALQKSYRMPFLSDVVAACAGATDSYISQSSFFTASRRVVHFEQTRAAWVDLDLYTIDKKAEPEVIRQIIQHGDRIGLPTPSAIIFSGRGVNLKWYFQVPITQTQLLVWQALQATLTAAYACFAADFKARDAARVFRLIGSINSKSGAEVCFLDGSEQLYDFGALCLAAESIRGDLLIGRANKTQKTIQNLTRATTLLPFAADKGNTESLQLYKELNEPIMLHSRSERSLNWARFCDMVTLWTARGGIPVGERDNTLFWMLNCLGHAGVVRVDNFEKEIHALLAAFPRQDGFNPLIDGSMQSLLTRLKEHGHQQKQQKGKNKCSNSLYRPSNKFLIDTLKIGAEEMVELKTIISKDEVYKRKTSKRDTLAPGRATRRAARKAWQEIVKHEFDKVMSEQGDAKLKLIASKAINTDIQAIRGRPQKAMINLTLISRNFGVQRSSVYRYWSKLESNLAKTKTAQRDAMDIQVDTTTTEAKTNSDAKQIKATVVQPSLCRPIASPKEMVALLAIGMQEAIKAKEAAQLLEVRRKILNTQKAWAQRKLADLMLGQKREMS